MEQKSIKITQVNVTKKNVELYVITGGDININDMLCLEYKGNDYYFRPTQVTVDSESDTTAFLNEVGYWNHKLSRSAEVNYKDLIGMEVSIVTDEETIKNIDLESSLL